jgi:hypothetical protein
LAGRSPRIPGQVKRRRKFCGKSSIEAQPL